MGRLSGKKVKALVLKDLSIDQAEAFFEHIESNRDIYIDTIPFVSKTHDLGSLRADIERNLARQKQGIAEFYTLWSNDRIAGYFLVREKDVDAGWAEIGYLLGREWHGQGITTEICTLLIEELFSNQDMQKIVICCNDDNSASIGVGSKLGFTVEGKIRNHFVVNGKLRNMLYLGLLKEEWNKLEKSGT